MYTPCPTGMAHQRLLIDLGVQFKCDNSGELSCAWKMMQPRGWRSRAALHEAWQELLEGGFTFEARMGRRAGDAQRRVGMQAQVCEEAFDDRRLQDRGDDFQLATAVLAVLDLDVEDTPEEQHAPRFARARLPARGNAQDHEPSAFIVSGEVTGQGRCQGAGRPRA